MRNAYALRLGVAASLVLAVAGCGPAAGERSVQLLAVKKQKLCLAAEPVDLGAGAVVTLIGDSTDTSNRPEPCGEGPGEYFSFTVDGLSALYVDTFGSSFDTVVGLLANGCSAPPRSCSEDACGTPQTQLLEIVEPGTYHLLVGGRTSEDRGPYVVQLQLVPIPSLPVGEIPRGAFELAGTISTFTGGWLGDCGRFPFVWYWYLSCPADSGYFTASTCNAATEFDAALAFVDVDDGEEVCCDDPDPLDPAEVCIGEALDQYPHQAAIQVWDEPEAGLHILKVGGIGGMSAPKGSYLVVGERP